MYTIIKKIRDFSVEEIAITAFIIMLLIVCIYYSISNRWERNFYCNNEVFEKLENDVTDIANNAGSINNIDVNELEVRRIECLQRKSNESLLRLYYRKDNIYIDVAEEKNGIEVKAYKQIGEYILFDFILIPMLVTIVFMFLYYVFFI